MDNTDRQNKHYTKFLSELKLEQKYSEIEPHNANLTQNLLNFVCERFDYKQIYMISQTKQYSKRLRIMICFSI